MRQILLMKQESPPTDKPWWLLEIFMTSQGPRMRVCEGNYHLEYQAQLRRNELISELDKQK